MTWKVAYYGEPTVDNKGFVDFKKPVTNEELKAKMEVIKQTLILLLMVRNRYE